MRLPRKTDCQNLIIQNRVHRKVLEDKNNDGFCHLGLTCDQRKQLPPRNSEHYAMHYVTLVRRHKCLSTASSLLAYDEIHVRLIVIKLHMEYTSGASFLFAVIFCTCNAFNECKLPAVPTSMGTSQHGSPSVTTFLCKFSLQ